MGEGETGLAGVVEITNVNLNNMEGVSSGIDLGSSVDSTTDAYSREFTIVPATVIASVNSTFGTDDREAEFTLTYDAGDNTDSSGDDLQIEFSRLLLEVTSFSTAGTGTLFNGNGDQVATFAISGAGTVSINIDSANETITDNSEKYRIETTAEASFRIAKDGVKYNIDAGGDDYSMLLQNSQSLGSYTDSN